MRFLQLLHFHVGDPFLSNCTLKSFVCFEAKNVRAKHHIHICTCTHCFEQLLRGWFYLFAGPGTETSRFSVWLLTSTLCWKKGKLKTKFLLVLITFSEAASLCLCHLKCSLKQWMLSVKLWSYSMKNVYIFYRHMQWNKCRLNAFNINKCSSKFVHKTCFLDVVFNVSSHFLGI